MGVNRVQERCYVYVLARTEDLAIQDALLGFYAQMEGARKSGQVQGLISIEPINPGRTDRRLDQLLLGKPQAFLDQIYNCPLEGLAIFSEWGNSNSIDRFVRSDLHEWVKEYHFNDSPEVTLTVNNTKLT